MKRTCLYICSIFKSYYCQGVFILVLAVLLYFLPASLFQGYLAILSVVFSIVFALSITCMTRVIKERVKNKKKAGHSLLGVIAGALGFSALQVCTVGAPVCGATLGMAFLSSVFPLAVLKYIHEYPFVIIAITLVIQIFALYQMHCFKAVKCNK